MPLIDSVCDPDNPGQTDGIPYVASLWSSVVARSGLRLLIYVFAGDDDTLICSNKRLQLTVHETETGVYSSYLALCLPVPVMKCVLT